MDSEHWLLRERVVEACSLVDAVRATTGEGADERALADLAHLRSELLGLTSVVCDDDPDTAEACAAGRGALEAIEETLSAPPRPRAARTAA